MWLHIPFLLLGSVAVGFKLPLPVSRPAQRCSTAAKPLEGGSGGRIPDGVSNNDKTTGDFVRPTIGSSIQMRNDTINSAAENILSVPEVVVATLVNTGPANTLLTPMHKWVTSRRRVAQAVKEAAASQQQCFTAATAAERERPRQQRGPFEEQQQEQQLNPWMVRLRNAVPLPPPAKNVYNALVYVTTVPGRLRASGKQTADSLSAAAEIVAAAPDRVRKTVTQTQEAVKTAQEMLAGAPDRVQGVATATQELPGRVERAVEEGTEAVEAVLEESKRLLQAGRQVSEAAETLPSRLPDMIDTATDDALSLASGVADGTAAGVDAAGTALWYVTKEAGVWVIERVLRQVLAPVHDYRTSARRVQAAVDEEQKALPPTRTRPRSSATDAAFLVTAEMLPSLASAKVEGEGISPGNSEGVAEGVASDNSDSIQVSRLVGLRGRFSSWRRKRRSIVAVATPDEADDDDADKANGVNNNTSSVASSSSSTKVVTPQEARGGTSLAGAPAESGITTRRSDDSALERQGERGAGSWMTPTLTAKSVTGDDGQITDGEGPLTAAVMNSAVGIEVSSKETNNLASPKAQASVSAAVENCELAEPQVVAGAPAPAGPHLLVAAGLEEEEVESGVDADKEEALVTVYDRDTLSGADVVEVGRGGKHTRAGESSRMPSPAPAIGPAKDVVLLGGLDEDTPKDNDGPSSVVDSTGRAAAAVMAAAAVAAAAKVPASEPASAVATTSVSSPAALVSDPAALEMDALAMTSAGAALNLPTASTAAGSAAIVEQQAAATSPAKSDGTGVGLGSAVSPAFPYSSSTPSGAALSSSKPPSPSETARENGDHSSNLATRKETFKGITKTDAREETPAATGSTISAGKPPALSSQAENDLVATVAAVTGAAPVAEGHRQASVRKAGGRDGLKHSKELGVTNPAAEFLKDWVEKAVPRKKAELKRMEDTVCWERQWYPVAIASELPHERRRFVGDRASVYFQMLGREYELLPVRSERPAGQAASPEKSAWVCQAVGGGSDRGQSRGSVGPIATVPVRESSGLLWAWPDTSPEGLATAALTNPVPVPEFGAVGGNRGGSGEPWRRLVRRRPASQRRRGGGSDGDENGKGGREQRANRRNIVVIEREISCGYSDAVGGLLTASHGEAVRVVAAGVNGNGKGLKEEDLLIDTSLASATGSSAGLLKAAFDTCGVKGEVLLSSPIVVEWRFSHPAPSPVADETAAAAAVLSVARGEKTTTTASRQRAADRGRFAAPVSPAPASELSAVATRDEATATPPRRGWLRRRLSGFGGGGAGSGADTGDVGVVERRSSVVDFGMEGTDRSNGLLVERGVRYVAVVVPVAPDRTKIFARLEGEPSGLLEGRPLWWSRRILRALLGDAIAAVAEAGGQTKSARQGAKSGNVASGGGKRSGPLSSVVGEWLKGTANSGPF